MLLEDEDLDKLICRAVKQTIDMGATYLAIPFPWFERYCQLSYSRDSRDYVVWDDHCGSTPAGHDNDDGDAILCLLPAGHQEPCSGPGTGRLLT